jgi:hypothetical protein
MVMTRSGTHFKFRSYSTLYRYLYKTNFRSTADDQNETAPETAFKSVITVTRTATLNI